MRSFHATKTDYNFVFHVRSDFVDTHAGNIGNEVSLAGSRAATVVVVIQGFLLSYGIARCQWCYSFDRKVARQVATGRALQALAGNAKEPMYWYNQGTLFGQITKEMDHRTVYQVARQTAINLIGKLALRAQQNGYDLDDEQLLHA